MHNTHTQDVVYSYPVSISCAGTGCGCHILCIPATTSCALCDHILCAAQDIIPNSQDSVTISCATLAISCATPWAAQDLVTTSCAPHPVPAQDTVVKSCALDSACDTVRTLFPADNPAFLFSHPPLPGSSRFRSVARRSVFF